MGRHSAPDGDESDDRSAAVGSGVAGGVALAPGPGGRHSRGEAGSPAEDEAGALAVADTGELAAVAEPSAKPRPWRHSPNSLAPRPPTRSAWPPRARPAAEPRDPASSDLESSDAEASVAEGVETAAPDDLTVQIPAVEAALLEQPVPEALTELIPEIATEPADAPATASATELAPEVRDEPEGTTAAPVDKRGGKHATAADVALLRRHGDVRARCLAGLLVPFIAYAVILLAIGSFTTRTVLLWLAAPIVVAGVLIGLFLDLGHRRHGSAD